MDIYEHDEREPVEEVLYEGSDPAMAGAIARERFEDRTEHLFDGVVSIEGDFRLVYVIEPDGTIGFL